MAKPKGYYRQIKDIQKQIEKTFHYTPISVTDIKTLSDNALAALKAENPGRYTYISNDSFFMSLDLKPLLQQANITPDVVKAHIYAKAQSIPSLTAFAQLNQRIGQLVSYARQSTSKNMQHLVNDLDNIVKGLTENIQQYYEVTGTMMPESIETTQSEGVAADVLEWIQTVPKSKQAAATAALNHLEAWYYDSFRKLNEAKYKDVVI
jgi:hypothetical protein